MHEATRCKKLIKRLGISVYLLLVIASCAVDDPDDDDSEGGVIGTGIKLFGTVTDVRQFASNSLQIMSNTGEVSNAVFDDTGRYDAPSVKGEPPFLIRADLGNNEYRYAISFGEERSNVHSYSDVIMRNWFAANNGNIDSEFDDKALLTSLPNEAQFDANSDSILGLVRLVLDIYGLTGEQLLSGNYDSGNDPQGIDGYLRANQMLIKDDNIAVIITDPLSKTQSTTRSNFSIFDLADEPDTESPEIPTSVRALPSASDEIVIVWEPTIDNRGVVGYEIFRDDALIATTPFPVYTDGGLDNSRLYTYYITAIDGSGNTSAPSDSSTTETLGELDSSAPPAPVQLTIGAFPGQMELIWGQSDIGDVVSFDVFRGRESGSLQPLTTVTSTFMTDATISSGVNYCYQVRAVDASGNESVKSTEVCQTATGDEVRSASNTSFSQVPPLAGLTIPDIESMDCTTKWSDYLIDTEVTAQAGCYLVDRQISVVNKGHLDIEPGVVLKFGATIGITVSTGGSLSSIGSAASPVVMTSQDLTPGYWNGVVFQNTNSSKNKLINTVVEYAGSGNSPAVALRSSSSISSALEISNNLIRKCAGVGFSSTNQFGNLTKLDGTVIADCDVPLQLHMHSIASVTQRNNFRDNRNAIIELGHGVVSRDAQLKDLGIPYVANSLLITKGALTVLEGVEVRIRSAGKIVLAGSLIVKGTEKRRVRFAGLTDERGAWSGIQSIGSLALTNADIEFAGTGATSSNLDASLTIQDGPVTLDSVSIRGSSAYAINYISGDSFTSNRLNIENNAKSIRLPISKVGSLNVNTRISDNDQSAISLRKTRNVVDDIQLINLGVPYDLEESLLIRGATLTLAEGVQLSMPSDSAIQISGAATIKMLGTSENPVSVYSKLAVPGSWRGIELNSTSTQNSIQNANIAFGGGSNKIFPGNISIDCSRASLSLSNTNLTDSLGWGIGLNNAQTCNIELGENVQFSRNNLGSINIEQ